MQFNLPDVKDIDVVADSLAAEKSISDDVEKSEKVNERGVPTNDEVGGTHLTAEYSSAPHLDELEDENTQSSDA